MDVWVLALALVIALLAGNFQVYLEAHPDGNGLGIEVETATNFNGVEVRTGWKPAGDTVELSSITANFQWPATASEVSTELVPIRFQIGPKGKLYVHREQRVQKGAVIAEKEADLAMLLRSALPLLDPELQEEAREKLDALEIKAVISGVIRDIRIEVEEETIHVTLLVRAENHPI